METFEPTSTETLVALTADVVAAYVANNAVPPAQLPDLISSVHQSLVGVGAGAKTQEPERPTPPVPVKKSITPDYLISLEDGRRYKSLKRHLAGRGLTPQQYRAKWGLDAEYPMVAPNYAKRRSELAKAAGLGRQRSKETPAASAPDAAPKKRGRTKAA